MENMTPIIIINYDESYRFVKIDEIIGNDILLRNNKIRDVLRNELGKDFTGYIYGSQGPIVKNINNGETFVIHYLSTYNYDPQNQNLIGQKFAGKIKCVCGYEDHEFIVGSIGFIKYKKGVMTNITEEDIKWLLSTKSSSKIS